MELRTALKQLRTELGMKQADLAFAMNLTTATVNRWETGKNTPNRSTAMALIGFAKERGASNVCLAVLQEALFPSGEKPGMDDLKYAQLDQINRIVNDSANAIFVCDARTRELLYINRQTANMVGKTPESASGKKCYEYLLRRSRPCEGCPIAHVPDNVFVSQEKTSSLSGRRYLFHGKNTLWNERPAHIEYITDITEFHRTREELRRSQQMMAIACRAANMWAFTVDVRNHAAVLEPPVQKAFHLPAFVPDFLEKIFAWKIVLPESVPAIREAMRKIQAGEPHAEADVRVEYVDGRIHWVRYRATAAGWDAEGRTLTAVCSAQMIDDEKLMELSTQRRHERYVEDHKALLGYVISNLSRNRTIIHHKLVEASPETRDGIDYEAAVAAALQWIEPEEARGRYAARHDRATLLRCFSEGKLVQSIEYMRRLPGGEHMWARNELRLALEPSGGDVLLYEYCFGTRSMEPFDGLLAAAELGDFDLIGMLSASDGLLTQAVYSAEAGDYRLTSLVYADAMAGYAQSRVVEADRAAFLAATAPDAVQRSLRERESFSFGFRVYAPGGGEQKALGRLTRCAGRTGFCTLTVQLAGEDQPS